MLQLSMESLFWDESPCFQAGHLVKTFQQQTGQEKVLMESGQGFTEKSSELLPNADQIGYLLRTYISSYIEDLIGFCPTWKELATAQQRLYYQAQAPELPINGSVSGWLHTPTRTSNLLCQSMMKHQCCRNFRDTFGETLEPWMYERMMGFPEGWTSIDDDD
jgi:hypothetical protein